ncbi:Fungal specific transcription factor domain [Ceratobasidium sp. AG-Ba]|nr:Fungal specific transcription factor domain [Ceratobasidium sp. AG-Ba]
MHPSFTIPQNLPPIPFHLREVLRFVMSSYEKLVNTSFFQSDHVQTIRVRESMSWRLQVSPTARWSMFIASKVFEGMTESSHTRAIKFAKYYDWIDRLEKRLDSAPWDGLTEAQICDRLAEQLELNLFRLRTTSSINTYRLLQRHAPSFLKIVSSDPSFWSETCPPTKVSLAHVLASERYEITHFALLDMMCALSYGLPQVIEHHVERELLDWKPSTRCISGEEGWKAIARLAVRESWRHALLIYLYMSICGVKSDDPRVRSSVKQIFQIIDTVREKPQPITRLHFSTQYLIAGVCTPNEKQRAAAREELSISIKTGTWLLNGSDFVPVLDHLWHGAAADGRAIQWSDYVHSRQVALPIPV